MKNKLHYTTRIVSDEEARKMVLDLGLTEEELLEEMLRENPPELHDRVHEIVKEIFHP